MENVETIGKVLRHKRELKNITLEQVAQKTKININILRHLENDELEKLPNKTYVKGFVANYARTVGWDEDEAKNTLLSTYQEISGQQPEVKPKPQLGSLQNENEEAEENQELKETFLSIAQSFFNKKIFISVIALLILAAIGKGVVSFFSQLNYEHEQIAETSPLKKEDENILEMDGNKKFAEEVTKDDEKAADSKEESSEVKTEDKKIASTPVAEKPEVKKEEEKEEEEEEETVAAAPQKTVDGKFPFKKFYQAPTNTFEIIKDSPEAADAELLPDNIRGAMVSGKQNVYITAVEGDTWIAYQTDNDPIKKYVLKKGRHVLIRGDVVKLFMGNYNVTKVFYNNQLINAFTKTGVKSLIFPEKAGKDLKLPLFPTFQGKSYTSAEYIENMANESI